VILLTLYTFDIPRRRAFFFLKSQPLVEAALAFLFENKIKERREHRQEGKSLSAHPNHSTQKANYLCASFAFYYIIELGSM
jgi:hypothetical protein